MTTLRWQGFLEELGYSVEVTESWSGGDADVFLGLTEEEILINKDYFTDIGLI